jgi:starch-binding outer membrane protein SusE/F
MKKNINIALGFLVSMVLLFSCQKENKLKTFDNGTGSITLTSSVSTIAIPPADSSKVALNLSWTNPKYAADSNTYKYVIEMDSTGRNFSKAVSKTVYGVLGTSFLASELNNIMLNNWGFQFNTAYDVDVRVKSSYSNNNEQYISNTIKIRMTPYLTPPKVALPTTGKLFLVGDASNGGWANPVPVPTQEFDRISNTSFAGVFYLNAAKEYLILPENGSWANKFSVANKSLPGLNAGGDFGFNLNDNFPSPATAGWYKIVLDFQTGKFAVTPFTGTIPTNLFIVGDATTGGWSNPVPVPSQQLTRINSAKWELTLAMNASKEYLLLPVNGDWSNKYAVADKNVAGLSAGGDFGYNFNDNFPGPTVAGNYKLVVNFAMGVRGRFTTTKL